MFLCTIFIWPCDLDLRPFDLGGVWWTKLHTSNAHTNFSILQLSVLELRITQHDHNGHCACAVSRDLSPGGGNNDSHFWNPWPQFVYSLCHFHGATTKSKPCYSRKIAFSHCEGYIVRMRSITLPVHVGSSKATRNNFWPRIIYSLFNLYGATTTIKGSFTLEYPHVKAVFGRKKTSSQNRSPKWRFFGNLIV